MYHAIKDEFDILGKMYYCSSKETDERINTPLIAKANTSRILI